MVRIVKKFHRNPAPVDKAQSLLEYVIIIGIVVTALMALGPLFKRGTQAIVKLTADQLAPQQYSEQHVTDTSGYLVQADTLTNSFRDNQKNQLIGDFTYNTEERDDTRSNSLTNLGFTNRFE